MRDVLRGPDRAAPPAVSRPEETDEILALRVRGGDADAFDALVTRHVQRSFRLAYGVLEQKEDAEDVVQEAFLAALEKIDGYDPERPFRPWLYRIVVNRALNARRARARRASEPLTREVPETREGPLGHAELAQLRSRLDPALDLLPERQRSIVRLADLEGLSSVEIGRILRISDGTVRWHLHRARRKLREALAPFAPRDA